MPAGPDLASEADGLPIRGVLSIPLTTSATIQAVLTLYSPAAGAFEPDQLDTARLIAGTATAILTRALHHHHLTRLLSNQQIKGHALSILKARYQLSDDDALELLGPHL